jgi:peptidoglycan/LPS O-acetylase OafA/YrhL
MPSEKHFWHRLESLRGIFALTVAFNHSLMMINGHELADKILRGLHGIFYGQGAVLSFFILIGLVLGQSLRRNAGGIFRGFYLRRLLRIYPALTASLILAVVLVALCGFGIHSSTAATAYYEQFYQSPLSFSLFMKNFFLWDFSLNNVTWTLWIEIIGSLFLPLMHVLSRKAIHRLSLMLCLIALRISPAQHLLNDALSYLWVFYLGYLIPSFSEKIWDYLSKQKVVLAILLLFSLTVCWSTPHFGHHAIPYVLAMGWVISCVYHLPEEPFFSFLDNQVVRFYGRISYSFYVLDFLILYLITSLVFRSFTANFLADNSIVAAFILALISIGIATPISYLSYLFIEKPFIRLGQKWAEPAQNL